MSPHEYVSHPDTEVLSLCAMVNHETPQFRFGENNIGEFIESLHLEDKMVIGHNAAGFDALLLAWNYNVRPRLWGCTMAMARPLHGRTRVGLSLGALVEHYGIGHKDNSAIVDTKGKHAAEFSQAEIRALHRYNAEDVVQCRALFDRLRPSISDDELWLIDATIRMQTEPRFQLDSKLLQAALLRERAKKKRVLLELADILGVDPELMADLRAEQVRSELASAAKFSLILKREGVDVPMKPSPTNPDKAVPALAKTDEEFIALTEHENPTVAIAAQTRLSVKSTLLEKRIEALLLAGRACGGMLPIPIRYCGAHTGRDSGEIFNPQNMPRIPRKPDGSIQPKLTNALRLSLRAPSGQRVIVADLSGIELRVNHTLWGVGYSTALWRADPAGDLYRATAARYYKVPESEVQKSQRQMAKTLQLGCGFGAGPAAFQGAARSIGGLVLSDEESRDGVRGWRDLHPEIAGREDGGWARMQRALDYIAAGDEWRIDDKGLLVTCAEGIRLPSGRLIRYDDLRQQDNGSGRKEWVFGHGRHMRRIYGGAATENCIAAGTKVLTDAGWLPIEQVTRAHLLHDGVEFVGHGGLVYNHVQPCVEVDGVSMTPDHLVLTDGGWVCASLVQEPHRPDLRAVDGSASGRVDGQEVEVGVPMRLRRDSRAGRLRGVEGAGAGPRASVRGASSEGEAHAQHVEAPGVCRVGVDEGALQSSLAPRVQELWRQGYRRVRALAGLVRELLAGHGAGVLAGAGPGSPGQRRELRAWQLPVDISLGQFAEPKGCCSGGRGGVGATDQDQQVDHLLPTAPRVDAGRTGPHPASVQPVYDIANCGPRQRFVVLGEFGPFIVHNCVQALARDILMDNAREFYRLTRLYPALRVHDELVYVVDERFAEKHLERLQQIMRTPPKWWPELITWSEGDSAESYGHAK